MLFANFFLIISSIIFGVVYGQFEVPEARVRPLSPRGLKVSIPDEEGIKLFAFHGKINKQMYGREGGDLSRDITHPVDGEWTFQDDNVVLNVGDTIYYWTYVDYFDGERKLGYTRDDQNFTITRLLDTGRGDDDDDDGLNIPLLGKPNKNRNNNKNKNDGRNNDNRNKNKSTTPKPRTTKMTTTKPPCLNSETTVKGGRKTCGQTLIFDDDFKTLSTHKWEIEHRFAGDPDYEFVLYENDEATIYVDNEQLYITPSLFESKYGKGACLRDEEFSLGINCTGQTGTEQCVQKSQAFIILPPVISGRINTKNRFSFLYGTVDIRAKLPKGDYMYPELYLVPKTNEYGLNHRSGEIRIAFLRGNEGMRRKLYGGVVLGSSDRARTYAMYSIEKDKNWNDDFHVYSLKWQPNGITVSVDGMVYGNLRAPPHGGFASLEDELKLEAANLWRQGTRFAPFDQEMYIVLGVGVGGHSFPDDIPDKVYKNKDPKNQRIFYNKQDTWRNTWDFSSQLIVDYVKVYSL